MDTRNVVPDLTKTSLGLEYFCNEGDALWTILDADLIALGKHASECIGLAHAADIVDGCVWPILKAYPMYDAAYSAYLALISAYVETLENFRPIGHHGLHRYNNQDYAMLTGMRAVRNVVLGEKHDLCF